MDKQTKSRLVKKIVISCIDCGRPTTYSNTLCQTCFEKQYIRDRNNRYIGIEKLTCNIEKI